MADLIDRQAVLDTIDSYMLHHMGFLDLKLFVTELPSTQQKMGHCKDCKWWKDKDGVYRRGIGAESKCPINRREVMEGMGYCFMFEPQESEV